MSNSSKYLLSLLIAIAFSSCSESNTHTDPDSTNPYIVVLGTVQDAGSPQIGCDKECCGHIDFEKTENRKVVCLGIVDPESDETWIIEASPDLTEQFSILNKIEGLPISQAPKGIFISHAHIGHYTGLMFLGRESMNASNIPVYCQPRLDTFLRSNGPWSQLVKLKNIDLNPVNVDSTIVLNDRLSISLFTVPHRDEFSETSGFIITSDDKSLLFIPDIDKWAKWDRDILQMIENSNYALLDATFYDGIELPGRDMSEIPHPFVVESMDHFVNLDSTNKDKVHFIHLNHTNPLLRPESAESNNVLKSGYNIAQYLQKFKL
jgi:pyrroloquinoline quinone biosynthesis protein B